MHCSKCGAENPDDKRFCGNCGSPFKNLCPKCGADSPVGRKFCGDCGATLSQPTTPPLSAAAISVEHGESHQAADGERRQLTVMFCDLVDSTPLSERLDPEDLRGLMQAYQQACVAAVTSFDGYVAKYLGDGLLVYFGYPTAHEDDAARAVRAGLAIVDKLRDAELARPLHVRVGIHTGLVVAGEMGSAEYPEHLAVVGDTPNIAARLQEQSPPDSVVVSPSTYRLVAGLFEFEDFGLRTLKGISTPLSIHRVVREGEDRSRFEVAVRGGLTPLVGREHELGLLRERWERARQGEGQVVLLTGEAGIGKSRLARTLEDEAGGQGATRIQFRCSPYHQNSAFYPITDHLQQLLGFQRADPPELKLEKLARTLSRYHFPQADTLPLLASLLSLPQPANASPITLSPQKQKEKTVAALAAWILEDAERAPICCVWEDLHWADPSSLEALTLLLDQVPTARFLALLTFRPDFRPSWPPRSHTAQLMLPRLGRQEVQTMVERMTGGRALPAEVMQEVVSKTDGVPLFVEELTKMVMESGVLRERDGHYELTNPQHSLDIPSSLSDSLMARLDRLGAAKEVAQLGAVLGREFSYELLQAVSSIDEANLQRELNKLVQAEILYQRGLLPQVRYFFSHALIQSAAYQSLLKSTRQQYHEHIAQTLAEWFVETTDSQPELLAHHYTEAGLVARAIPYWLQAGQRAARRSAHVEAIGHLTKGLELLATLPDTPERAQQELALQMAKGTSLFAFSGFAAQELGKAYQRAHELCRQLGETPQLFPALAGLRAFYTVNGEIRTARELAEQLLRLAESAGDPGLILEAHYALGITLHLLGEFVPALEHCEQTIALYDPRLHHSHAFLYGMDPGVTTRSLAAWIQWELGYPARALEQIREALTLAKEAAHPFSVAYALTFTVIVHMLRGEIQAALESANALIALSQEQAFSFWLAEGILFRGWLLTEQGKTEEGIAGILQGIAGWRASGAKSYGSGFFCSLAEAYLKWGHTDEGMRALTEAQALTDSTGERHHESRLCLIRGELLRARGKASDPEAEQSFRSAIRVAQSQHAKSLELRATISLARLFEDHGRRDEARAMLGEIYGWFTEGFDTADLKDAKALLDQLNA